MNSLESVTIDSFSQNISSNISITNITLNGTMLRVLMKRPHEDSSINSIIFGIGLVVVILICLLIIIKLIHKCYRIYHDEDDTKKEDVKRSPLLPPKSPSVRRNSSLRSQTPSVHRSSLNIETQMELKNKSLLQTKTNSPATGRKS